MDQIKGFKEDPTGKKVYMLIKSIYRLKQVLRVWQQSFYKHLKKLGFNQLQTNLAVFICKTNGIPVIIITYIDNIAIISPLRDLIDKFKSQLAKKFEIEDNRLISLFLRLKVT